MSRLPSGPPFAGPIRGEHSFRRTPVSECLNVSRSELIQLVTVTQREAERSYRELIEQQISVYKSR